MKILIYAWSLSNGGAERVAALWAEGFMLKGHVVCMMLGSFESRIDYPLPSSIRIIRQSKVYDFLQCILPSRIREYFFSSKYCNILYNVLPNYLKNWFTSRTIKKEEPDLIIIVLPGLFERIRGALDISKKDIPVIVTDHNAYERPSYAPFSSAIYYQKFVRSQKYDILTVLTEADKLVLTEKMDEHFMKKVFVLPNPLTFKPVKKIPKKQKVIIAAGRMEIWHCKGFDLLIKAWAMIQHTFPDWKLKIAGGGDCTPMKKLCQELNIVNRVDFLGFVDLKKEFEQSEIFVLSSRYEGFGMVLTEAMSQGCACIACDYKGRQREIIEDDSQGIICPTDDEKSIAKALNKLILNDSFRHFLQKNAIERSKNFELSQIMEYWDEIIKKTYKNKKN